MVRKKLDSRIRALIENAAKQRHRCLFVIVGDKGREQIMNLHYILSKMSVRARPSVLWCYKKDLGFSSNYKKRMRLLKKSMNRGQQVDTEDPFELFLSSAEIRYTYYKDSHKIMGQTFGMCILQDFEALTPNLLARTIETVEGGGVVVLLLNTMSSLQQLYTLSMDVHARFRSDAHPEVVPRFNERFLLSLCACEAVLLCDDELNVLPVTTHMRELQAKPVDVTQRSAEQAELEALVDSLKGHEPAHTLLGIARTLDQAKALLTFVEAIGEKKLRSTVTLTAARGRGKSAALGVALGAAIAFGYANIFVTSPHPDNLRTLFDFVFKAFDALHYEEHVDYDIQKSAAPEHDEAVVRVNVYRQHRQTIQYVEPSDCRALAQAELVVIDEAAAIPLPIVKELLGPYLVFMASTVNGYEGTGRSLSLKLIRQLRDSASKAASGKEVGVVSSSLRELTLSTPIRYALNDPVERWLNELLCLDATRLPTVASGCPPVQQCALYHVNRDTLFSYHRGSEAFLQRLVALFVASHYKNTPNDLLLMSDAPAHHLFVLLGPVNKESNALPEILCAVQVALEGAISREAVRAAESRGKRDSGDLIPWTISQQFQDEGFPTLSGARVVRIATHPAYQSMGYGQRALQQLLAYYRGELGSLRATADLGTDPSAKSVRAAPGTVPEVGEIGATAMRPRSNMPPLLDTLDERPAERLDWLGVSYGLTLPLYRFWAKAGHVPLYVRQTPNEVTGEHTIVMLRTLHAGDGERDNCAPWLAEMNADFERRMRAMLGMSEFRSMPLALAMSLIDPLRARKRSPAKSLEEIGLTSWDAKRVDAYARGLIEYRVILDLVPTLARRYFDGAIDENLGASQCAVLAGFGLQQKTVESIATDLGLQVGQVLAQLTKLMRRLSAVIHAYEERRVESTMPKMVSVDEAKRIERDLQPLAETLEDDLKDGSEAVHRALTAKLEKSTKKAKAAAKGGGGDLRVAQGKALLDREFGDSYKTSATTNDWGEFERTLSGANDGSVSVPASISVKRLAAPGKSVSLSSSPAVSAAAKVSGKKRRASFGEEPSSSKKKKKKSKHKHNK